MIYENRFAEHTLNNRAFFCLALAKIKIWFDHHYCFSVRSVKNIKNKHKFVQKVAKKIIILIYFIFSANINFVQ